MRQSCHGWSLCLKQLEYLNKSPLAFWMRLYFLFFPLSQPCTIPFWPRTCRTGSTSPGSRRGDASLGWSNESGCGPARRGNPPSSLLICQIKSLLLVMPMSLHKFCDTIFETISVFLSYNYNIPLLPTTYVVRSKIMFSQMCVILFRGGESRVCVVQVLSGEGVDYPNQASPQLGLVWSRKEYPNQVTPSSAGSVREEGRVH